MIRIILFASIISCSQSLSKETHQVLDETPSALASMSLIGGVSPSPMPQIPAVSRDVHMVEALQVTRPFIPALRLSADGRLGINSKPGPVSKPNLFLLTPEKLKSNLFHSAPGANIVTSSYRIDPALFRGPNTTSTSHIGICDAQRKGRGNPYVCPNDTTRDCYDITLLQSSDAGTDLQTLWGTPATIQVANPKTATASIAAVSLGTPVKGSTFPMRRWLEIAATEDGHLMIARISNVAINWKNSQGISQSTIADTVYLAGDPTAEPCDIRQFTSIAPITHAPYDAAINKTYGFAKQPFRDPLGNVIADGVELGITYPWIDKGGSNIGFTTVNTTLYNRPVNGVSTSKYPAECATAQCAGKNAEIGEIEEADFTRGKTLMGLWTNGKMVMMDNLINNIDFGLHVNDEAQRLISLYEPLSGPGGTGDGKVRVGSGRDNRFVELPGGTLGNITFLDSAQNRFNFHAGMQAISPRDVVWTMNSGVASDEFAFDDHVNPDGLIVSSMVQAFRATSLRPFIYDGIDGREVWVQNAATALPSRWKIPAAGKVTNARIEPTATGGLSGKGLWLSGNRSSISYTIPAQATEVRNRNWYMGLFIDSRFPNDTLVRTLLKFPDGSELQLRGRSALIYAKDGTQVYSVNLPSPVPLAGWAHIGLQISQQNRQIQAYLNGFRFSNYVASTELFTLVPGDLLVGDSPTRAAGTGFRGWIDDFKVFAQRLNPEVACNMAAGTLVGISDASTPLGLRAATYPKVYHLAITNLLSESGKATFGTYACYYDYQRDHGGGVATIPSGTTSIRGDLIFPEGPLVAEQPRPDSTTNAFCLSCHTPASKGGLGLDALKFIAGLPAMNDARRQPMQPSPRVYGNVPANWLCAGVPSSRLAPLEGVSLDLLMANLSHCAP